MLQPWDLWTHGWRAEGSRRGDCRVLERVLELDENHPGANHFYIHAVEASPEPERALEAAKAPGEPGARCGTSCAHARSHLRAAGELGGCVGCERGGDRRGPRLFQGRAGAGILHIYYLHNMHFLAWSAMMEGRYEKALEAARGVERAMPERSCVKWPSSPTASCR
jgi:hypothetical protein